MLQPGSWIRSLKGETAHDESDREVQTGPNAPGCVRSVETDSQGKPYYSVMFCNNV